MPTVGNYLPALSSSGLVDFVALAWVSLVVIAGYADAGCDLITFVTKRLPA